MTLQPTARNGTRHRSSGGKILPDFGVHADARASEAVRQNRILPHPSDFVYPAIVAELKWDKDVHAALKQIKERKYPESITDYTGEILLVGISYDTDSKEHSCIIEKYEKQ